MYLKIKNVRNEQMNNSIISKNIDDSTSEVEKMYFPLIDYFYLYIPIDISSEFNELVNQIFILAKLKDYDIGWVEFPQNLHITLTKSDTMHQISLIFDENMYFKAIIIDWGPTKSDPIEALQDFLKKIVESE